MKYIFDCGCRIDEELVYQKRHKLFCLIHPKAKLIGRETSCIDCGRIFESGKRGSVKLRCPTCEKLKAKKVKQKFYLSTKTETLSSINAPKRKQDCEFYDDCLQFGTGKLMKDSRACQKCNLYKHKDLDPLDYIQEIDDDLSIYCFGGI